MAYMGQVLFLAGYNAVMSLSQPPIGTVVTTDPVTGLPLTSTDTGIIDQIPVNSDPRALQDWSAVGRPSQSLYPDDFPWVMSTTHAQNSQNPQSAQAMQTDGNHRLLVNTGASSGGGLTPQTPLFRARGDVVPQGGGAYTIPGTVGLGNVVLVGWDIAHIWTDATSGSLADVSPQVLIIEDTVTLTDIYLGTWFNQYFDGTANIGTRYSQSHYPPVPISLADNAAQGGGAWNLIIRGRSLNASLNVVFHYYAL